MITSINLCMKMMQGMPVYRRIARSLLVGISVREANEEDKRKVSAWLNPGRTEPSISPDISYTRFVAEKDGRLIGTVDLVRRSKKYYPYDGYWLQSVMIKSRYRGLRIGEKLTMIAVDKSRQEGAKRLSLITYEDNIPSMKLARKLGFQLKVIPELDKQSEQERNDYGRTMILMCMSLT